jgi:hypothetical protein
MWSIAAVLALSIWYSTMMRESFDEFFRRFAGR